MHISLDGAREAVAAPNGVARVNAEAGEHLVNCRFDSGVICSIGDTLKVDSPEQKVYKAYEEYSLSQALNMTMRGELKVFTKNTGGYPAQAHTRCESTDDRNVEEGTPINVISSDPRQCFTVPQVNVQIERQDMWIPAHNLVFNKLDGTPLYVKDAHNWHYWWLN
jgi:hypothetical protein